MNLQLLNGTFVYGSIELTKEYDVLLGESFTACYTVQKRRPYISICMVH